MSLPFSFLIGFLFDISGSITLFTKLYPSILVVYPFTSSSVIVYTISSPSELYFGKLLNSYFHPLLLSTFCVSILLPFANRFTLIETGLVFHLFS